MKDERWCSPKKRRLIQAFILQPSALILCVLALLSPVLADQNATGNKSQSNSQVTLLPNEHYFPVLIDHIRSARHSIDMAMYIFKTNKWKNNRPSQLATELISARKRGVSVQIILEKSDYNNSLNEENERLATWLGKHKINVRFDSLKKTTHTKMVIIDQRFCFVGSHNFTQSALAYNHEMSLLLDNRAMAKELSAYIADIK